MPDRTTVMAWLEGLAQDDWRMYHSNSEVQEIARNALELLKEQPELVRCKDCRYYTEPDSHGDRCDKIHWSRGDDWFCADGKRR